jgi:nicotinate-nucleotide adenylyltransferase
VIKKIKKPSRIGIFGGTFDPPHNAHITIAKRAMKQLCLDMEYFVPAFIPPHKGQRFSTTAQHRLKMVKLAIQKENKFKVSSFELKRRGISYTVDTLKSFKKRFPNAELVLIIGTDNFAQFNTWRSPRIILRLASLAVYRRKGSDQTLNNHRIAFELIKGQLLHVSSTEIRKRIEKGLPISTLIPRSV